MVLGAFLGLSVASCADQNFDWENAKSQNPEYTFRTNFEKIVGTIDPNQSWDFSTAAKFSGTRATRADISVERKDYYELEDETLDWLTEKLPEGDLENRALGTSFSFIAPAESFSLIPIYQGHAGCVWDLYVEREDGSVTKIWTKSQGLQRKRNGIWENVPVDGNNNKPADAESDHTMEVQGIRGQEMELSGFTAGEKLTLYLEITKHGEWVEGGDAKIVHYFQQEGAKARSDRGMMVALPCPTPSNLGAGYQAMIIGCEDNDFETNTPITDLSQTTLVNPTIKDGYTYEFRHSDWDMNDIVFLLKSKETKIEEVTAKRYMVEDLGSSSISDIDFNDIVIDIEERTPKTLTTVDNQLTFVEGESYQRAKVWAMGGTLDFFFMLKETAATGTDVYKVIYHKAAYKEYKEMLNTNPADYTHFETDYFTIEGGGWVPSANNVAFLVCRDRNFAMEDYFDMSELRSKEWISLDSQTPLNGLTPDEVKSKLILQEFPGNGETPFIVAFDTQKQWRDERHPICSHWLFGGKDDDGTTCPICGDGTDYGK